METMPWVATMKQWTLVASFAFFCVLLTWTFWPRKQSLEDFKYLPLEGDDHGGR